VKLTPLKEFCTHFGDGDWIESKDQSEAGIRLIQTGNVGSGIFKDRVEKARWISEQTFSRLRCTEVVSGDVLVSRLPEPVGRACIIPSLEHKAITSVDCSIVRFDKKRMDPEFFVYYTKTSKYSADIKQLVSGSTRERISREKLGGIGLPDISLDQQSSIVQKLKQQLPMVEELMTNINNQEILLEDLAKARVHRAIAKAAESSHPVPLGSVCTITSSKRIFKSEYATEGVPFYRTKEIKELAADKKIRIELFISRSRYEEIRDKYGVPQIGDVLLSAVGTIGEVFEIRNADEFYFKDGNIVWLKNLQGIRSDYLALFLESSVKDFNEKAQGSAYSALTIEKLNSFQIPLPNIEIQQQIVEDHRLALSEIAKLRHGLRFKKSKSTELSLAFVEKAFEGVSS
jgi:type I restriction enzyme S subunit